MVAFFIKKRKEDENMFITDIYNSSAIATYITESPSNAIPYLGEAYFPTRKMMGIDIKWIKAYKGLGVSLKPSAFDAIPTVRTRGQAQITKEQMPLFRESMVLTEADLFDLARIKDSNDPYLQPVADLLFDDANELKIGADIAVERERMSILAPINGDVKIVIGMDDNVKYSYNYDANGDWKLNNYLALSGTSTWDNASTSTPLDNIRTAVQKLANKGYVATTIISNSSTFNYLLNNDQVKGALVSLSGRAINFIDTDTIIEVIRRTTGLTWIPYDKMYKDSDGTEKKFYPDNYVTILGNTRLGYTYKGTTPEELTSISNFLDIPNPPVDITVLPSGVAIAVQNEYQPSFKVTTTVSQIALPSYEGMDGVFVIKVK